MAVKIPPYLKFSGNMKGNQKRFKQDHALCLQTVDADKKEDNQKIAPFLTTASSAGLDKLHSFLPEEINNENIWKTSEAHRTAYTNEMRNGFSR